MESLDLKRLYPLGAGDPFLKGLSKRAAELSRDKNVQLNKPQDIVDLAKVCLYDTVIFCGIYQTFLIYYILFL